MAFSPDQTTRLSSENQEASLKACRSFNDRISNLPDALIHLILSFLPTKQAMATSVLSKRWLWLWTFVPTLYLEDSYICKIDEKAKMKFLHFVYRVLLLNKAGSVEKFCLNCNPFYDYSCVNTWICSAVLRRLREVDISVSETADVDLMKLPSGLFLMQTLKILKLHGAIMVDVPASVCFPSLKTLYLLWVSYANVESIRNFISGCPSLEELRIEATISDENVVNFIISTPTLNWLSLSLKGYPSQSEGIKIEISAPALEYLNFSTNISGLYPFYPENFPCLIEANIFVEHWPKFTLFRALNAAKYLKLDGHLLLPIFSRIDGRQWIQPKTVPTCFSSSLSRACFEDFEGLEGELQMVEYFLKNATVLRTMEIYTSKMSSDSELCFLKKLSMFPRSSVTCQLSFN
ncbi:hypothetical protein PTKIN_Ptkin14bG0122300 [Pterospermum kingtungense]